MQNDTSPSPEQEPKQGFDIVKAVKAFAIGAVTITGLVLLATRSARASKARKSNSKSMKEGSAENVATRIRMAMGIDRWGGTDEAKLRELFQQMPSQDFYAAVGKEYEKQNSTVKGKASMEKDLKEDLTASEFEELMFIVNSKPQKTGGKINPSVQYQKWAGRLKAAFDLTYGPIEATDEDAIEAVLREIPSKSVWTQVKITYKNIYKRPLEDDLKDELLPWEYSDLMKIIDAKKP